MQSARIVRGTVESGLWAKSCKTLYTKTESISTLWLLKLSFYIRKRSESVRLQWPSDWVGTGDSYLYEWIGWLGRQYVCVHYIDLFVRGYRSNEIKTAAVRASSAHILVSSCYTSQTYRHSCSQDRQRKHGIEVQEWNKMFKRWELVKRT